MKKYIIKSAYLLAIVLYGPAMRGLDCANLAPEPANLSTIKDEVLEYHDSGAWDKAIVCKVEQAKAVLQNYKPAKQEKPAVVFDIDETSLSNWDHLYSSNFGYIVEESKKWENSMQDTAIPPVLELYVLARKNGFTVFFISGRRENQRAPTEANLKKVGFDTWQAVYLKPMDFTGHRAMEYKSKWRAQIQAAGYTIVLNIGDQQSDLDGDPQAKYNFKISNPAYIIP